MFAYILKRLIYAIPIALSVTVVSFVLVYLAPGDPLNAIAPADAPEEVIQALKSAYGLDKPVPVQYGLWLMRAVQGDLGLSIASGREVTAEVLSAVSNTLLLAGMAAAIGVVLGCILGALAGYRHGTWIDKAATALSVVGVSIPHYWLGLVLTILFSIWLPWFPAMGAGPGGSGEWLWDLEHLRYLVLPALTLSVIPMGIITRTVRALVADMLGQEFVTALRARGLSGGAVFRHVAKNTAPTVLAVAGLQIGYLMGGSILVETVFAWPGTGFLLNTAIFQRDIPLLQGTILVLCMFFVVLNLLVDILQPLIDPRMGRS
ncbi:MULTISPECIES: ABC transporter permease [Azospira]|jgi:peptide/nickel transport system permease protein|uniref:ABC-type dipeptide/oligopeptide/nickel transport system, permease component n=2 Tax=Azospira oryzae TaxID=146939 RepID=G8QPH0_AZOOP|nr:MULTISPECIES: ABC transporter permease [Azospira]TLS19864.1 MAG: ABC transporter permease [Betaproteobacteria bacterium]AEV24826.1 ABC-type dipeptide/oligopeptide/nickel transport system, permease component [Azospira oryzae PS]MBP7489529.1 ABC transporter permease [Azospira sp.]MDK9691933.1 ABC transporter permease [Azospira sp.]RZT76835.1 peptide/nickel transport system permease protein [Azospira oryzae]